MATTVKSIGKQLRALASAQDAAIMRKFFKSGPGEYGEGDQFIGIKIPPQRTVAKASLDLPVEDVPSLLASSIHELRSVGLMIWVLQFQKGDEATRTQVYELYLDNTQRVNNWDLVDLSAPGIVGGWLLGRSHAPLEKLARSRLLWERRIAVVSTLTFIRAGTVRYHARTRPVAGCRRTRPDAQGLRVDATRSIQTRSEQSGRFHPQPGDEPAANHASLRHRAVRSCDPAGTDVNPLTERLCGNRLPEIRRKPDFLSVN